MVMELKMNRWRTKEQKEERDRRIIEMRDKDYLNFDVIGNRLGMHGSCANTNYHRIKKEEKERKEKIERIVEEMIEVVLENITCSHKEEHDEDGTHISAEYDIDSPCEQKIIEILEKEL